MKIHITLENAPGSVLAEDTIDVPADADQIDDAVSDVIESWVLSVGDTIKIREVEK